MKCVFVFMPADSEVKSCVDIGNGSSVDTVDEFCYLGDMLSEDGDADADVTVRICSGWFKFKFLASFLTVKDVSFLLQGKIYYACVHYSVVCYTEVRLGH